MQLKKEQLQRQQMIMSALGYYRHRCDGIWGPESIAAKRRWESEKSFIPALPNNGLPFGDRDTYPVGVTYDRTSRMLGHASLTQDKIDGYVASSVKKQLTEEALSPELEKSVALAVEIAEQPVVEERASEDDGEAAQPQTSNFQYKKHKR